MFSKEIKSDYLKEIADSENIKQQIRNTECIYIGYDLLTTNLVPIMLCLHLMIYLN